MKQFNGFKAKEMTLAQKNQYLRRYAFSNCTSVKYFYRNPSILKCDAEEKLLFKMSSAHGHGYKILGGNCSQFSAGYIVSDKQGVYLVVETAYNTFYTDLER